MTFHLKKNHNLIALSTKDFQNRGMNIKQFIQKGHLLDDDALEGTLQARKSPWEMIKSVMQLTSISWTAVSMVGVTLIRVKLFMTNKRRKAAIGGTGISMVAVQENDLQRTTNV